jgi:hypothetical protein
MLQELTVEGARRIAALAKTARRARDAMLDNVPEEDLGEPPAARGEHNPTGVLGFDPLPLGDPAIAALRQAVSALGRTARSELFILMRMGQGDLAAGDWDRGLSEAERLGDETVAAEIIEDPDLHEHITKSLYEAKLSS